ncbi:hypothetical protein KAR91_05915 [Candidatus Pacearchaeota archaeon]|nr:hypothetical protein [Candidatus Pacearchaeota archaeon]
MSKYNEGIATFQAGEALVAKTRVKIESGTVTTPPEVVYADAGEDHIGVAEYAVADEALVAIRMGNHAGTYECMVTINSAIARGTVLYGAADGKLSDASSGSALAIALEAATADDDVIEVYIWSVKSTTAAGVSVADSGSLITATTVEAALAEAFTNIQTAQAIINLPLGGFTEQDGTVLADFADGDSTTPGVNAGDESFGIRWNNHANPDPISTSVPIPPDLDASADVVLHVLAAKVGATVGDAVTWLVEAFNNADAALYDADADFGGTSSAMTGDATSKTCQEETLTLASANVAGSPCVLALTIQPTDGTLDTDDVIILGAWLEYTRKTLTS